MRVLESLGKSTRVLTVLVVLVMALGVSGCSQTETVEPTTAKAQEATTAAKTTEAATTEAMADRVMIPMMVNGENAGEVEAMTDGTVSLAGVAAAIGSESPEAYVGAEAVNDTLDAVAMMDGETLLVYTELPLQYSESFAIEYLKGGIKKLTDGDGRVLILAPDGAEIPAEYPDAPVIAIPLEGLFLGSTTQGALLRPIGEEGSVVGVATPDYDWYVEGIKAGLESGDITFVGDAFSPDYELITALEPALAMVYTGPYGQVDMIAKFDELGIDYTVVNSYLENDPFGRMEWVKFQAAFYDKEMMASELFDEAVARVAAIEMPAEKAKVAWASIYQGDVYVPGRDTYVAKMIEAAGGDFVFDLEGDSSSKISLEEFYLQAAEADVLIYSSSLSWSPTLAGILEGAPSLIDMKAVEAMNVWCFHPDYHQSVDKTDELILDLAKIFAGEGEVQHYVQYTE